MTPPFFASAWIISSVMLRATGERARQEEWEAKMGAWLVSRASAEGFVGDVRDIDDHAEAVHFADDFFAESGRPLCVPPAFRCRPRSRPSGCCSMCVSVM